MRFRGIFRLLSVVRSMHVTVNYRGGGLLIATYGSTGRLHILLGLRKNDPGARTWSFPGGKCEHKRKKGKKLEILYYTETYRSAASREAIEEIQLWQGAPDIPEPDGLLHLWGLRTFFFDWSTYGWLVDNPDLRLPTFPGSNPHVEFTSLGWFLPDSLPEPLHFGVRAAIRKAQRQWKEEREG